MTYTTPLPFCSAGDAELVTSILSLREDQFEDWKASQDHDELALIEATGFKAQKGQSYIMRQGDVTAIILGLGDAGDSRAKLKAAYEAGFALLAPGVYQLEDTLMPLGDIYPLWAETQYRFNAYKKEDAQIANLIIDDFEHYGVKQAISDNLVRDMVNMPTNDMGPEAIEAHIRLLADEFGAELEVIKGDALLSENYPLIHAVGRAAEEAPRLLHLRWGKESAPKLALIGKGVAFDTGGLNIKTGNFMRLMKKDMGGAAHAIGLARMVMDMGLDVNLSLLIPAVENAISDNAFRPGDVIKSREGITVEIDNTDAEGRLILADALTRAAEDEPDLIIDFATLTGAARVALGPEVIPYYTKQDDLADTLQEASETTLDPLWQMPLWENYNKMLSSKVADMVNSAAGGFAGSIIAALFLQRFIKDCNWLHFDIFAWEPSKSMAKVQAIHAVFEVLKEKYG